MKHVLRVLPIVGVVLLAVALTVPAMYGNSPWTRANPHAEPLTFLPMDARLESYLRSYLLAAVLIGGGVLVAIAVLRGHTGGFASGYVLACGLVGLAMFLGFHMMILEPGSEPHGNWSVGPGYFLGVAGGLVLIVASLASRTSKAARSTMLLPTAVAFAGVALLAIALVAPTVYRNFPDVGSFPGPVAQPIVSFDGSLSRLLSGYLLGALLVGGGLWAALAIARTRGSGFAAGLGLGLGLVALATFLGHVLLILIGPHNRIYPEGGFSVGFGFFLGIAGALLLVLACLPRSQPSAEAM